MKKVIVGSGNPVKMEVTEEAFKAVFPTEDFEFVSYKAESGVADQPFGDDETRQGAQNRSKDCRENGPEGDYFVGLEGGIEEKGDEMWSFAWMCVSTRDGKEGFGRAASFMLPKDISTLIKEGMELAHAGDKVFNENNIGQKAGVVSALTNGVISRKAFYFEAMVFALIPFVSTDLY